jgi:hypothetical protein
VIPPPSRFEPDVVWDPVLDDPLRVDVVWPGYVMVLDLLRVVKFEREHPRDYYRRVVRFVQEVWQVAGAPRGKQSVKQQKIHMRMCAGFQVSDDVGTEYDDLGGVHGPDESGPVFSGEWMSCLSHQ